MKPRLGIILATGCSMPWSFSLSAAADEPDSDNYNSIVKSLLGVIFSVSLEGNLSVLSHTNGAHSWIPLENDVVPSGTSLSIHFRRPPVSSPNKEPNNPRHPLRRGETSRVAGSRLRRTGWRSFPRALTLTLRLSLNIIGVAKKLSTLISSFFAFHPPLTQPVCQMYFRAATCLGDALTGFKSFEMIGPERVLNRQASGPLADFATELNCRNAICRRQNCG